MPENDLTQPDPGPVLDLLQAFRCSKAMFAALSLGVFDALTSGPKPLDTLAGELRTSRDGLQRLLDACVGLRLLGRDDRGYSNTPTASIYLCQSSPHRLTGYINYSNDVMWKLWGHLEDAVREGSHRWAQMQNLNMLTCTEGEERTLAEYEALLRRVGFSEVFGHATPSPLDAILAVK